MVPATTAIRRSKVGNIDTDRLFRRRSVLALTVRHFARSFEQRHDWVVRVAELVAIERELVARGDLCPTKRLTT